jgi:hypothetical protein
MRLNKLVLAKSSLNQPSLAPKNIMYNLFNFFKDEIELDISLARLEYLMDRRPLMLNKVLLRQNPHNVQEWLKRITLVQNNFQQVSIEL